MKYSEENWPKVEKPGSMDDPIFAAIHMTNLRWIRAMGHGHYSRTDPEFHVKTFRESVLRTADSKGAKE